MKRQASLRVVRRPTRWFSIMPAVRWATLAALCVALVISAARWLHEATPVGALAFTPHVVGESGGAVGVKDAVGRDLNGDSRPEVITAGDDGVKIYENTGDWKWALHVVDDKPAERIILAQIDSDDDLDFVVNLKGDSPSVRWYENKGDFEFESHTISTAGADAIVAVGDLNMDGALDLATSSGREEKTLQRWMNNGNGVFVGTTLATDSKVTSLAIGRATRGAYPDIVTGGAAGLQRWTTTNGTTWIRADIDDSNENRTYLDIAHAPNGSAWIATADATDNELMLYRGGSSESFYTTFGKIIVDEEVDAKTVRIVDVDSDNDLDLLVAGQDNNEVYWYANDGLDSFSRHTIASSLQSVFSASVFDMDTDSDLDILTADHHRGTIYVLERLRKKPTATAPSSIQQSANASGHVTFVTTLADDDGEPTRARIQYSKDGKNWYKPWLVKAQVDKGTIDLENRQGFQVGTKNDIDTDTNETVTLTLTWDTKSSENTGGPLVGDLSGVQLRVIPRDERDTGVAATSNRFRVDNAAPRNFALKVGAVQGTSIALSWNKPTDSSGVSYELYYGTNATAVLERKSAKWTGSDEEPLTDIDTTSTTVTGLDANKTYTFKLFAVDEFGNMGAAPSVTAKTTISTESGTPGSPTPTPTGSVVTPLPPPPPDGTSPTPTASPAVTPIFTVTPTPIPTAPTVLDGNVAPIADAGPDQVVNPRALVILDGIASYDVDPGDSSTLVYNWRQLSGPTVDFLSERTATPSFSAGGENETYIFLLTVKDVQGASAIDTVTVATKALPESDKIDVDVTPEENQQALQPIPVVSPLWAVATAVDVFLLTLSLLSTIILILDRVGHAMRGRGGNVGAVGVAAGGSERAQSRVVHYKTGLPIAGATVLVYGEDGKLRAQERTNAQGSFASFFPPGVYTLGVRMEGFALAPAAAKSIAPTDSIMYSGGKITVKDANHPPAIIIPMKPIGAEVTTMRVRLLHAWQQIQYWGRTLSWPLFVIGALLNTTLVFVRPTLLYLVIEVVYIVLVIIKIAVEIRLRPAYGLVRDAITHIPLELAVVRLMEQGTNRLVMTRVTNNQGKFFALPPAGTYTISISKPGYGTFTKEGVEIVSDHDSTLQMVADLMPVSPVGAVGLARARAATI